MNLITQNELKEVLNYDPETGVFTWLTSPGNRVAIGGAAGSACKVTCGKSYQRIMYKNIPYYAHRLAWLYVYGSFPEKDIDHIDGNGLNNKIDNLRAVTHQENGRNRRQSSANTSGCTGVTFYKRDKKWYSHICINGKMINLGFYIDWSDAVCARKSAEIKYGFHENHGAVRPL